MQRKKDAPFKRQSRFNEKRDSFLDSDFNYVYKYKVRQKDGTEEIQTFKIPYSEENREIFILLDRDDHASDLGDRYEEENADWSFRNQQEKYFDNSGADSNAEDFRDDPIDTIADPDSDVFDLAFPEYKETSPEEKRREEVREWIATLPESQQNLIFAHLGEVKFLEDVRREEELVTGKKITKQAMHNRWNKILVKFCKHLGVEKPKKHNAD